MKKWLLDKLHSLEAHVDKPWYPFAIGSVAFAYHFLLVTPVDSLFVTSTLLVPKRWVSICLATTIGFTLGATVFAFLVQHYGMELVEHLIPGVTVTQTWSRSEAWIHHYGVLAVGGFSLLPLAFHPLIAIAALQKMSIFIIAGSVFLGRLIKYAILGWFCAFLPAKLPFAKKLKNGKH